MLFPIRKNRLVIRLDGILFMFTYFKGCVLLKKLPHRGGLFQKIFCYKNTHWYILGIPTYCNFHFLYLQVMQREELYWRKLNTNIKIYFKANEPYNNSKMYKGASTLYGWTLSIGTCRLTRSIFDLSAYLSICGLTPAQIKQ